MVEEKWDSGESAENHEEKQKKAYYCFALFFFFFFFFLFVFFLGGGSPRKDIQYPLGSRVLTFCLPTRIDNPS